jgi:hypothetical protein
MESLNYEANAWRREAKKPAFSLEADDDRLREMSEVRA